MVLPPWCCPDELAAGAPMNRRVAVAFDDDLIRAESERQPIFGWRNPTAPTRALLAAGHRGWPWTRRRGRRSPRALGATIECTPASITLTLSWCAAGSRFERLDQRRPHQGPSDRIRACRWNWSAL